MRTNKIHLEGYRLYSVHDLARKWEDNSRAGVCHYFLRGNDTDNGSFVCLGFDKRFLLCCFQHEKIILRYKLDKDPAWIVNDKGSRIAYLQPNTEESRRLFVSRFCRHDQYAVSSLVDLFS